MVKEGDKVKVKLLGFDERGKVRLSMKVVDQATGEDLEAKQKAGDAGAGRAAAARVMLSPHACEEAAKGAALAAAFFLSYLVSPWRRIGIYVAAAIWQIDAADHAADDRRDPEQPQRAQASEPPKIAVAVERAGLSEALDTGIATRWNSISASPIAIGAKPAGARGDVTLTITSRNSAVITISISATATSEKLRRRHRYWRSRGRCSISAGRRALQDDVEHGGGRGAADHLRDDVGEAPCRLRSGPPRPGRRSPPD